MKRQRYIEDESVIVDGQFKILKAIGAGMYGQIYLGVTQASGFTEKVAVKVLPKEDFTNQPDLVIFLTRETAICQKLKHKNICNQIGVKQDSKFYYIIQEYCEYGNLAQRVKQTGIKIENTNYWRFPEETAISYMKQIMAAFEYINDLSEQNGKIIIHRDIKLENIFIGKDEDDSEIMKIGDFGFAREKVKDQLVQTYLGSPFTQAPEISIEGEYDERADIYSLGIMFYQMMFGTFPFKPFQMGKENLAHNLAQQAKTQPLDCKRYGITISQETEDLLKKLITFDPKQRIIFQKLFRHKYFRQNGSTSMMQSPKFIVQEEQKFSDELQVQNQKKSEKISIFAMVLSESRDFSKQFIKEYIDEEINPDQNQNVTFQSTNYKEFQYNGKLFRVFFEESEQENFQNLTNLSIREKDFFLILVDCDKDDQDTDNLKDWLERVLQYVDTKSQKKVQKVFLGIKDKIYGKQYHLQNFLQQYGQNNGFKVSFVNNLQDIVKIHQIFVGLINDYCEEFLSSDEPKNVSFALAPSKKPLPKSENQQKKEKQCC